MHQTGTGMHLNLLQRNRTLLCRSRIVVSHRGRRLHRNQSERTEVNAGAGAQVHRLIKRFGKTVLQNHTVCRHTVRVFGDPTHVLHQSHALAAVRRGRHGTVHHRVNKRVKLRGERIAAVTIQVADNRLAELQILGGLLQRRNLIVFAIPQVNQRERRNIKTFQALHMERVTPSERRIITPSGSTSHHNRGGRPLCAILTASNVKPLLGARVSTVTSLNNHHVVQSARHFHGNQRRNTDRHVRERTAVHIHGRTIHRFRLRRLHRIGKNAGNAPQINEFTECNGLAVLRTGNHLGNTIGDLIHGTREHHNLHELAGRSEHHTLSHIALAAIHRNLAQRTGRHFGNARHGNIVKLSIVDGLLSKRNQQVLSRFDSAHFAAQTPVDQLRVSQGSLAAARSTALGTGSGNAHARLTQHSGRIDATLTQRIDQRDRGGGLALAARRLQRGIGGDEHDLAMLARGIRIILQIIEIAERINLLHQAVLAGEILNAGHWGFLSSIWTTSF